ncbi:Ribokinase [Gracilariopsis chorda]|uniref:Ribokinase n=1 Tax=Gracilariopsis chorda TaxID=448386 RepID=A0A2V3IZ18_9FLOR|nr:Ribokinase [Gracilariopsis chorda]|eukprot:PXF47315.1 Ribokinase [Gracilariopsis chorda]
MTSAGAPPPVAIPLFLTNSRVLSLGLAAVDLLARVPAFPRPDEKIRTTALDVLGGGNAANTLTALRRLGVPCALASKLGDDMYGRVALRELQADGIDTRFVRVCPYVNTTFTYVIVDNAHNTRTCISTPASEDLFESDIDHSMLDGVQLLLLDGRHTLAAVRLAQLAKQREIPILLDIERERPHIRQLLSYADYVITNSMYPQVFAPDAKQPSQALQQLLEYCDARFVISTRGASGSVLVRENTARKKGFSPSLKVHSCSFVDAESKREYEVIECAAWPVEQIVDSTGAGDAFIAGVAYGVLTDMDLEGMLSLGAYIAATKLSGVGSRSALPRREDIGEHLLGGFPALSD